MISRTGLTLLLSVSLLAGCDCAGPDLDKIRFRCASQVDCLDDFACVQSVCVRRDAGAGLDGGMDAGADAGTDAGVDGGEPDGGSDAGVDAGAPQGTSCGDNLECASGFCTDGVCCDSACPGLCDRCNASGTCVPAGPLDGGNPCGAFRCLADAGSCTTSCTGVASCASAAVCLTNQCLFPKPNGSTCTVAGECANGNCVDGTCCNSACGAACDACDVPGSLGTCTFSPLGRSCGVYACSGTSATCPTSCMNDTMCTPPHTCSWFGSCIPPMATFKEDFNDNVLDAGAWDSYGAGGARAFERNQQLEVTLGAQDSGYAGIYLRYPRFFSLIGSSCTFEVRSAGNQQQPATEAYLALESEQGNRNGIFFNINNNTLTAFLTVDGGQSAIASTSYSPGKVRYLRLREATGTTYWEYSDGGAYQTLVTRPNPIRLNGVGISIGAGTYAGEMSTSVVIYDNINVNVP